MNDVVAMSDAVAVTDDGGVRIIRLNRPEKKNALTLAMYLEMTRALKGADAADATRCVVITGVIWFVVREPRWIGVLAGTLFAAYGSGLAVSLAVSVLGAYSLPETANPFALNSGAGTARSLLAFLAMVASAAAAMPMVVATALLGDVWLLVSPPIGIAYGIGAADNGYLAIKAAFTCSWPGTA